MLTKGEARGEPVLKEGPRLEVPGLVWEPAMDQWPGVAAGLGPHPFHCVSK